MAIVYANAAGNWSDISIWYSEGQPYNQEPQDGDTVYANGFSVTMNSNIDIGSGTIRNDECPYTNNSGGNFSKLSGTIIANLICGDSNLIAPSGGDMGRFRLVGDVVTSENSSTYIIFDPSSSYNCGFDIVGNLTIKNGGVYRTHAYRALGAHSVTGNVIIDGSGHMTNNTSDYSSGACTITGNVTKLTGTGSIYVNANGVTIYGDVINESVSYVIGGNSNIVVYGALTNGYLCSSNANISIIGGGLTSNLNSVISTASSVTSMRLDGIVNTTTNLLSRTITTLNLNGTINTSAPLATNLTTLNLNGTINTSNDTIADFPITTTNIQQGSHITYTQQQPLGWGELNAPADFEFEYNGSGVSTGAYIIVNKNEFQQSYPQPSYVVSGTTYGDSSQFTGTMEQPDESVVLKDYVYASGTKTGTLDTSSLDVPSDLTQQFNNITNKLGALQTRLSIADIIEALNQYTAVKVSDLASISIDTQDIEDALEDYGVATSSDLANVSTLTTTDLSNSLTTYGAAKPSDVTSALNSYGASTLTQSQVESSVQSKLNSYGAAKPSDVTSALNSYGAAKPSDVSNALSNYGVANYNTVSNAISNANLATADDIEMIAENMATEEFIAAMINGTFVY